MQDKIMEIASIVFDVSIDSLSDDSSSDTVDKWDSLSHMNLVTALEEEFDIRFSEAELSELLNLRLVRLIIEDKLNGGLLSN